MVPKSYLALKRQAFYATKTVLNFLDGNLKFWISKKLKIFRFFKKDMKFTHQYFKRRGQHFWGLVKSSQIHWYLTFFKIALLHFCFWYHRLKRNTPRKLFTSPLTSIPCCSEMLGVFNLVKSQSIALLVPFFQDFYPLPKELA